MTLMKYTKKNLEKVGHMPCVYSHHDKNGKRIRVGKTGDCNTRLNKHLGKIDAPYFSKKETKTQSEARSIEKSICKRENLPLNLRC